MYTIKDNKYLLKVLIIQVNYIIISLYKQMYNKNVINHLLRIYMIWNINYLYKALILYYQQYNNNILINYILGILDNIIKKW